MSKRTHRKIAVKDQPNPQQNALETKLNPKDTPSSYENLKAVPSSNSLNDNGENAVPGWTPDEKSAGTKTI